MNLDHLHKSDVAHTLTWAVRAIKHRTLPDGPVTDEDRHLLFVLEQIRDEAERAARK